MNWEPPWLIDYQENKHKKHMALVIRHSEKTHYEPESPHSSVHLTQTGIDRAKVVGQRISGNQDIRIFTSPILRCIETSNTMKGHIVLINEYYNPISLRNIF